MASALSFLNSVNEIAFLSGIFDWEMSDGKYTTPDKSLTVSFHIVTIGSSVPITQYIQGAINTFSLSDVADPNQGLFNTQSATSQIRESIARKYAINRVPFSNADQLVDIGTGSQRMTFNVLFAGTMYQTAMRNFIQAIFNTSTASTGSTLGTLQHPFYNTINNVLPIKFDTVYEHTSLNFVACEITFLTSDLTHLSPAQLSLSPAQIISSAYTGTQAALTAINTTITTLQSTSSPIVQGILG